MNKEESAAISELSEEEFSAIGFWVGDEEYGLSLFSVQEIITRPRITRVPKSPDYIAGVINLHGNIIPVIDLAKRFKIGETVLEIASRVVVVESNGEVLGLLVEKVSKVARFKRSELQPPPPLVGGISSEYLEGVVRVPGRFLVFLNLDRTLADDSSAAQKDSHQGLKAAGQQKTVGS
ncbi:purine-binding chemotaxis protein CheW [Myxococcota bacterium]|nr:purine-binding chemotaxis protein CheW [Myxococcota bacterium]